MNDPVVTGSFIVPQWTAAVDQLWALHRHTQQHPTDTRDNKVQIQSFVTTSHEDANPSRRKMAFAQLDQMDTMINN